MRKFSCVLAAAIAVSGSAVSAATLFSDDFNNSGYAAGLLSANDTSDRYGATDYYFLNNFNGWTFDSSNTFYAVRQGGGEGSILLNENGSGGSASRTLTGLTSGKIYTVDLLLSGDNRPGQTYTLFGAIDGTTVSTINGVDLASGTNPGALVSFSFTAAGTSALLTFTQASGSEGSPIFDNVTVTAVPEPATWGLMLAGFGLIGFAARRRRVSVAA